jgi:hemolysin activation/secretion protein
MRKHWRALCIALFALAPGVALGAAVEHVRVDPFAVYGNTQLTPAQLAEVLAPFSGRELDGTGLAAAATALRDAYRRLGLFAAEVFIPPHAIDDGVATLHVYEGVLERDGVFLENNGRRVRDEVVLDILGANLASGKLMRTDDFERALLLVEDLPGITAHSLVYPGTEAGEARFLMRTEDTPAISGNVDIDNFGSVYTGQTRLGTTLYWNSPSGLGDQATLRAVASDEDYRYLFLDYSRPMAGNGLRAGLNADYLNYELGDKFDGTGARGDAVALRVFAAYPFVRTRHANSRGRLEYAYLRLDDDNNVEALRAERQIHTLAASVSGDLDHDALADGITYFDLAAVIGRLGIIGSNEFAALEAETTDAEGEFGLLRVHLSRLQHIAGNWSAFGSLEGQAATGNLDPSQKFFIGGPFGVPGYPTGEASGDHGVSVFADLRRDFTSPPWGGNFQLSVFYAQGHVQLYDETWDGWQGDNPLIRNSIRLSSWGVAMSQTWPGSVVMRGSIGRQIGSNPGRNPATGADSDGSTSDHRAWFQLIYYF